MLRPPLPHDEPMRLAALHQLGLLDTEPEARFDRITRLVQRHFNAPIVLLTLVDQDRQWFKSRLGLDHAETPREVSFCAHAVAARAPLIVPDTLSDPRFADHPLVVGEPRLRFYAGVPLRALNGQPVGTFCLADTTPRSFGPDALEALRDFAALAERELLRHDHENIFGLLRQNEERLHLLVSTGADGFFDQNHETGLVYYAPQWKRMLGYEPAELADSLPAFLNLLHPDDLPAATRFEPPHQSPNASIRPFVHEFRLRHRDGRWLWIESRGVAMVNPGTGVTRRVLGFHADITNRRELEAQMRMLDQAVNHIEEAISVLSAEDDMSRTKIIYVNPAFTRLTGYSPGEAIGRNPIFLLGQFPEAAQIAAARIAVSQGRPFRAEIVNYRKDGTPVNVDWAISPVRNHLGRITHWVSMRRDITGRKLTQAALLTTNTQLAHARDAAESANRAKSRFLANLNHEIRTPLNRILDMSQMLAATPLNAGQRENLGIIQRSGEELLTLISSPLDPTRIGSASSDPGRLPFEPSRPGHDLVAPPGPCGPTA